MSDSNSQRCKQIEATLESCAFLEVLTLGIMVHNEKGHVLYANERAQLWFAECLQIWPQVPCGWSLEYRATAAQMALSSMEEAVLSRCHDALLCLKRPDGQVLFLKHSAQETSIHNCLQGCIISTFNDVTDIINDQDERDKLLQCSLQTDYLRTLGRVAASLSHEICQPLTGIKGLAEYLWIAIDRGWEIGPSEIHKMQAQIIEQVDRINTIITHLRDFSGREEEARLRPTILSDVIEAVLSLCRGRLEAHGIEIRLNLDRTAPPIWPPLIVSNKFF